MSEQGSIRIIVGASSDRSIEQTFSSIEKRAQKAGQNIAKAMGGTGTSGIGRAFDGLGKSAEKAGKQVENSFSAQVKAGAAAAKAEERVWQQAAKARVKAEDDASKNIISGFKSEVRERAKLLKQQEREEAKSAKAVSDSREKFANRASRYALRDAGQVFRAAGRFGMDIARGAGVDMSVGSLVGRTVGIESAAVGLSSRGHIEGAKGANGTVVSSGALEAEARKAGLGSAVNPEEILGAGRAFVGLTGDLDLWRKIMPSVVKQTAALGGNQEDAAKAAGEFAAHVGDVPNKEQEIMHLMAVAAGQGKIGGVDFSDFAKYAANAAAPASMFAGDKAQNIGKLMALGEISKMHGGSRDPAIAFGSLSQFSNTLQKTARRKSIAKLMGNESGQFTDTQHSDMRGINEIIKDLIWGAAKDVKNPNGPRVKANRNAISDALGDVRATKAITGLIETFNTAGGGAAGMKAVTAELDKFDGAIMSSTEIERANAAQLATTKSQTELFNQQLESISHGVMQELGPAMKDLAPTVLSAARELGGLASWAAGHPWEAAGVAVAGAVSKGVGEAVARAGLEAAMTSAAGGMYALGGVGIAAAAAWAWIENDISNRKDKQGKEAASDAALGVAEGGGLGANDPVFLKAKEEQIKKRLAEAERVKAYDSEGATSEEDKRSLRAAHERMDAIPIFGNTDNVAARLDANHVGDLKEDLQKIHTMLGNIARGIPVTVANANEFGQLGPKVFAPGREHNPGELPAYLRP